MKNKKGVIILSFLIIFILGFAVIHSISANKVRIEGRYLLSDNGTHFIVSNYGYGHSVAFQMGTQNDRIFKNLNSGDKIRITSDGIVLECDPPIIGAFSCKKLEDGDLDNIQSSVLQKLTALGWINSESPIKKIDTKQMYKVSYQEGKANMSIQLFDHWDYEFIQAESSENSHGISFWPKSVPEGSIDLLFYPADDFQLDDISSMESNYVMAGAVPDGTSLYEMAVLSYPRDEEPKYNFLESKNWDYIQFSKPYSQYVFVNNSSENWTKQEDLELPYIIDSIKFY